MRSAQLFTNVRDAATRCVHLSQIINPPDDAEEVGFDTYKNNFLTFGTTEALEAMTEYENAKEIETPWYSRIRITPKNR